MITYTNHSLKKSRLWQVVLILLLISIRLYASATWEEMNTVTRDDSLEQKYYAGSEYTQRYMLKLMPLWLEERGMGLPGWVEDAVEDALYHGKDGLYITEAIKLTQRYGLSEHYERLIELYRNAYTVHAVDADNIRSAVVNAVTSFSGSVAEYAVPELFFSSPHFYIDREYTLLLLAVAEYGDTTLVDELEDAEYNIQGRAENIDEQIDPVRKNEYLQVLALVRNVKETLLAKGGM